MKKNSKTFLNILFYIYVTVTYYSNLMNIIVPNDIQKVPVSILDDAEKTMLRFSFQKNKNGSRIHTVLQIADILNDYLQIVLLPNQTDLQPFQCGTSIHDAIEPLYVDMVFEDEYYINIDVIFVDNPLAFQYIKRTSVRFDI